MNNKANMIQVAFVDGVKTIPLDQKTMETMTNFFELKDGVFYFSTKKQKAFINKNK